MKNLKFIRENLRGLKALREDLEADSLEGFLRMDYSISKFPPSPKVIEAIKSVAKDVNKYPDGASRKLREALAKYNGVDPSMIIVGNGADEIIDMISRTFLEERDEIIIFTPTYAYYEYSARVVNARVKMIPSMTNNTYSINVEKAIENVSPKTKIIWICNPNNPTGTSISQQTIKKILENTDCIIAIDECLFEFFGESSLNFLKEYDRLIIVRSMSKTFSLAGLRIGYAIANTEIIEGMWKVKSLFNVNLIAQVAGVAALEDINYYKKMWKKIADERKYLAERLSELKCVEVLPSTANFILINVKKCKKSPEKIYEELIKRKIFILPSWSVDFSGLSKGFFRILVSTREENDRLVKELSSVIRSL